MATKANRPERTPLANRSVLGVKGKEPGYVYRIVNDVGERVAVFQEQGYEVVTDKTVSIGDRRVGRASQDGSPVVIPVGNGVDGVLMRQKEEFYQEDQRFKESQIAEQERSMQAETQKEGNYGTIKIS
jgi:hypothetical protein